MKTKVTEDKMRKQTVMCDGKPFEYDVVIPAGELRPYILNNAVSYASAQGTGLSRDLYLLPRDGTDKWVICGSDGIIHELAATEPVYVSLVDLEAKEKRIAKLRVIITEIKGKYIS